MNSPSFDRHVSYCHVTCTEYKHYTNTKYAEVGAATVAPTAVVAIASNKGA